MDCSISMRQPVHHYQGTEGNHVVNISVKIFHDVGDMNGKPANGENDNSRDQHLNNRTVSSCSLDMHLQCGISRWLVCPEELGYQWVKDWYNEERNSIGDDYSDNHFSSIKSIRKFRLHIVPLPVAFSGFPLHLVYCVLVKLFTKYQACEYPHGNDGLFHWPVR